MYKVIFKVSSNGSFTNSLKELRKAGFIPIYFRRDNGVEEYTTLYNSNDINEVKEAIIDFAYLISKQGKNGGYDFAKIYKVEDKYIGKLAGGGLGALLGYQFGGIAGLILGTLGGIFLGELFDISYGQTLVGLINWPIQLTS
ncbi:hypothetical protein [Sulfurisphaera tokodaii]|uniref:DUF1269 domain-containing protein n=2 Tax=Sulfurisphaera tokodaii TaxID=111955 RepID=Q96YZ0_SULTO|nr:hypothetical protein [Sulfurisphaera tokodaii]BAB67136.1 hypothetical protein STK_20400 [Sulfurisphaera tokodaii str. 7]HII72870.1 hypothetical protein [Sulfurisphaera tokodaii]